MKKLIFTLTAATMALVFTSCGPTMDDAIKYNEQFISIQKSVEPVRDAFIDQIDGHNTDSLKITHEQFSAKAKSCVDDCQKINEFGGKRDYLDAAIEYFKAVQTSADVEGKQLVQILTKDTSQVTENDVADVTRLAGKFDTDYAKALQKVQDAQLAFSKEWKFEIKAN